MNVILQFEDLQRITRYTRVGDVVRSLRQQGIVVFFGKGGEPWTTIDLVNQAGGRAVATGAEPYPADTCQ